MCSNGSSFWYLSSTVFLAGFLFGLSAAFPSSLSTTASSINLTEESSLSLLMILIRSEFLNNHAMWKDCGQRVHFLSSGRKNDPTSRSFLDLHPVQSRHLRRSYQQTLTLDRRNETPEKDQTVAVSCEFLERFTEKLFLCVGLKRCILSAPLLPCFISNVHVGTW